MRNLCSVSDFDLFRLSDEHQMLREAVRAVCDDKIAPLAAEVDETGEFPQKSYDALRKGEESVLEFSEYRRRELPDRIFTKDYLQRLQ